MGRVYIEWVLSQQAKEELGGGFPGYKEALEK